MNFSDFDSVEKVAQDIVLQLAFDDRKWLLTHYGKGGSHDIYGSGLFRRDIRNEYYLWYDNPLTENWRNNESTRDIRDGIDYSRDNPDQVAADIADRVIEILKEQK